MGSNRRYGDRSVDRWIDQATVQGEPVSLTDAELGKPYTPLTLSPEAIPVLAWLLFPSGPLQVRGEAIAWTARAVLVRWKRFSEQDHHVWVWAGAVERVQSRT